jgi:hypothetical protein
MTSHIMRIYRSGYMTYFQIKLFLSISLVGHRYCIPFAGEVHSYNNYTIKFISGSQT